MIFFFAFFGCQETEPKPQGFEPEFEIPTDGPSYIPVAEVKAEYDRGAGFYFLEINSQPGLTKLSLLPEQANYKKINFETIVMSLLNKAL